MHLYYIDVLNRIFLQCEFFCKFCSIFSKAENKIHCKKWRGLLWCFIHQFRSFQELNRKICDGNFFFFIKKQKFTFTKINSYTALGICCIHVHVWSLITGTLEVNDEPLYTGSSLGQFSGLDLGQNMYLGNVPDANNVPEPARYSSGFVGKKWFCLFWMLFYSLQDVESTE